MSHWRRFTSHLGPDSRTRTAPSVQTSLNLQKTRPKHVLCFAVFKVVRLWWSQVMKVSKPWIEYKSIETHIGISQLSNWLPRIHQSYRSLKGWHLTTDWWRSAEQLGWSSAEDQSTSQKKNMWIQLLFWWVEKAAPFCTMWKMIVGEL